MTAVHQKCDCESSRTFAGEPVAHVARGALLGAMVLVCGCGGPKTYPVTGEVVIVPENTPLAGTIEFHSVGITPEYIAEGAIGEDGKFTLATNGVGRGAVPGEYQVVISPAVPDSMYGMTPQQQRLALNPIDSKYRDYSTSPLRFQVTQDAAQNHFRIEVERPANQRRGKR